MKWNYIVIGKTKVAFDYNTDLTGKESLTFKMVNTKGEEIEKTIQINDQFYLDMIKHSLTKETESQKVLTVNYKEGSTTTQYKVGEESNWADYTNTIRLDDYQILETLGNENRNVKVSLRQVDNIGNEIIIDMNYNINDNIIYRQEDTVIEGESILACVENNNLESGNYIFRVTGKYTGTNEEGVTEEKEETKEYPVELYNYNEDANYIASSIALTNGIWYTGFGHINSEKRMLILKYNGDLTINSGVTITPTGTNASINGATYLCTKKGMLIYCAGTLTNNGTITMTAKGTVNQEGENVYLYKNENESFEYIPAVGGAGGTAVSGTSNGNAGEIGVERKTGGGGSGASYLMYKVRPISGAGSYGTSYSGGSGGGSAYSNGNGGYPYGQNGGEYGGKGGNGGCNSSEGASGGAGNPGGIRISGGQNGETGTGGLLVIYSNTLNNSAGSIIANGSNGGGGNYSSGAGSGGGSINIFYKNIFNKGNESTLSGAGGVRIHAWTEGFRRGGSGGTGCITIGNISTGTFVKDE